MIILDPENQKDKIAIKITDKDGKSIEFDYPKSNDEQFINFLDKLGFGPSVHKSSSIDSQNASKSSRSSKNQPSFIPLNTTVSDLHSYNLFERVQILIKSHNPQLKPFIYFTSKDLQDLYKQHLNEPIKASTLATYLLRLLDDQVLKREGSKKEYKYLLVRDLESIPFYDQLERKIIIAERK